MSLIGLCDSLLVLWDLEDLPLRFVNLNVLNFVVNLIPLDSFDWVAVTLLVVTHVETILWMPEYHLNWEHCYFVHLFHRIFVFLLLFFRVLLLSQVVKHKNLSLLVIKQQHRVVNHWFAHSLNSWKEWVTDLVGLLFFLILVLLFLQEFR